MRIVRKYQNSGKFELVPTNIFPQDNIQKIGYTLDSLGRPILTYMLPTVSVDNHLYSSPSSTMFTDNIGILLGEYPQVFMLDGTLRSPLVLWAYNNIPISAEDIAYFVPYVGDVLDAGVSLLHLDLGNYGQAALGLSLLALPNILEKPLKRVVKYGKSLYDKARGIRFNVAKNGRTNLIFDHEGIAWRLVPDGTGIPYALLLKDFLSQEHLDEALDLIFDPSSNVLERKIVEAPKDGEPLPLYNILDNYTNLKEPGDALGIGVGGRLAYAYYTSPERLREVQNFMKWDDKTLAEYVDELRRNFDRNFNIVAADFPPSLHGQHEILLNPVTGEVRHKTYFNQNEDLDKQLALEIGTHEIGAHGGTFNLNPSALLYLGSDEEIRRKAFPRIYELMQKNVEIAKNTLKLNSLGNYVSLFNSKIALLLSPEFKKASPEMKNYMISLYDLFHYLTSDLEVYARGLTGKIFDKYFPGIETNNISELKTYYTPESVEAYKKALLGLAPWLFGGTVGYNYLNPSENLSKKLL